VAEGVGLSVVEVTLEDNVIVVDVAVTLVMLDFVV
jgi:hypothetical protein